jgi:hypothetical protein
LEKFKKKFRKLKCGKKRRQIRAGEALQIIGHIKAESYVNKRMGVNNLWSQSLLYNKSYVRLGFCQYLTINRSDSLN